MRIVQLKALWWYYTQFQLLNMPMALFFALFTSGDAVDVYFHFILTFFGLQLTGTKLFAIFIFEHRYKGRYYLLNNLGISKAHLYGFVFLVNLIVAVTCGTIYLLVK